MPRMSKRDKLEWSFFIGENGRRKYNKRCLECERSCKQSFRATLIQCPSAVWKPRGRLKANGSSRNKDGFRLP